MDRRHRGRNRDEDDDVRSQHLIKPLPDGLLSPLPLLDCCCTQGARDVLALPPGMRTCPRPNDDVHFDSI